MCNIFLRNMAAVVELAFSGFGHPYGDGGGSDDGDDKFPLSGKMGHSVDQKLILSDRCHRCNELFEECQCLSEIPYDYDEEDD